MIKLNGLVSSFVVYQDLDVVPLIFFNFYRMNIAVQVIGAGKIPIFFHGENGIGTWGKTNGKTSDRKSVV